MSAVLFISRSWRAFYTRRFVRDGCRDRRRRRIAVMEGADFRAAAAGMRSASDGNMRAQMLIPAGFCLLLATACGVGSPAGPSVQIGERFELSPGETAAVERTSLRLQFAGVTGDSRCPADVVCIQGGDAIVHIRVLDGLPAEYELHTGDSARAAVTHGAVRIELLKLEPYPFSSQVIRPGDYRATLLLTR
jgi:hypothetical protein